MGPLVLPLIAAGAGMGQSAINALTARYNTDKTIRANKELAQYQYSKDLEMWNKGNAYNSPQAQMQRLKEAGLNPMMVYGSGSTAGNTASQLPKYNAPTVSYNYQPPIDLPGMLAMFQDFQVKNAQIRNLEATGQGKDLANQFAGNSMFDRLRLAANKGLISEQQISKIATELGWMNADVSSMPKNKFGELKQSQLEYVKGQSRQQWANINKMIADTEYKKLQTEWFTTNAIASLFGKASGMIKGLTAGAKGVRGSFRGNQAGAKPYQGDRAYEAYQQIRRNSYYSKLKDRGFYD